MTYGLGENSMLKRFRSVVRIILKSDLCVSSGQAYAGIIDTDVCMNKNGFPYIPAKRLKGVMREAGELLGYGTKELAIIFGQGGDGYGNEEKYIDTICLEDATLGNKDGFEFETLDNDLNVVKQKKEYVYLSQQNVLNLFSSIKAQTRINEKGVAEEETLRFTRVINQYLPKCIDSEQSEMFFEAPIEYAENVEDMLKEIITAVRHIGMDRNRGLGNVRCELDTKNRIDISENVQQSDEKSVRRVVIQYTLTNKSPLMLSSSKDDVSETYISGQVMLGALAGVYLKSKGLSEPDDTFNAIFLSGDTIFSNLYITSQKAGNDYVPAPLFINRLKKTKQYVCVVKDKDTVATEYDPQNGNQPKKLTGKYIYCNQNKIRVLEPKTDIVYHHSKKETYDLGRMGDDKSQGILYANEVLESDQMFSGSITVTEKYAELIEKLLNSSMLRLGKSKSSQYGHCICDVAEKKEVFSRKAYNLKEGEKVYLVFASDVIISGYFGYTTDLVEVEKYISDKTGLIIPQNAKVYVTNKVVTGYNAKINLKKAAIPAIAAGSAFECKALESRQYNIDYLGSFISEGYGKVYLMREKDLFYAMEEDDEKSDKEELDKPEQINTIYTEICRDIAVEKLKIGFIDYVHEHKIDISAALLGRVTLMLKESSNNTDALKNFADRIASIKRDKERIEIISKLRSWKICDISLTRTNDGFYKVKEVSNLIHENEVIDEHIRKYVTNNDLSEIWQEYLSFILVHLKYGKSAEKKVTKGQ